MSKAAEISFVEEAPDAAGITRQMGNPVHPWLAAEDDRRIVGYASTSAMRGRAAYRWSVETGVYVSEGLHGRGIGRRLLATHIDPLERQGFVTIVAGIALPNASSANGSMSAVGREILRGARHGLQSRCRLEG